MIDHIIDALCHIPLYLVYLLVVMGILYVLPTPYAIVAITALIGYLREVTQKQANHDNLIWRGWLLSPGGHVEWMLPSAALLILVLALD